MSSGKGVMVASDDLSAEIGIIRNITPVVVK
jgi:hypothetical protein